MRDTERFTAQEMADYTIGWDAGDFRGEGDFREYVQTYIMRPLSGDRRVEKGGPAAPVAGAGAGAGTSRTARVRSRSGARRGRGVSWPALPTTMTCRGQGRATYQIPFAPPPTDHELVGFYDLPPVCTTSSCILHCHFISVYFDIPQNTDAFDTLAGFFRVYPAVLGAECLHDGDVAADFQAPGPL